MPNPAIIKLFSSTFSPLSPLPPYLRDCPCATPKGCGRCDLYREDGRGACFSGVELPAGFLPPSVVEECLAFRKDCLGHLTCSPEAREPFSLGDP